jgi:hypothetical protein
MSYLECCETIGRSLAQSLGFVGVKIGLAFLRGIGSHPPNRRDHGVKNRV